MTPNPERGSQRMIATRRQTMGAVVCAFLALIQRDGVAASVEPPAPPKVGSMLRLVDLPLIEGGILPASSLDGKVAVIYWWASWCPFCAEMTPSIQKLWQSQRERGLTVVGISIDKTADAAREYRRRRGYDFPSAILDATLARALPKPRAVPTLWARDRQGRIVVAETGQMFPEDIEELSRLI